MTLCKLLSVNYYLPITCTVKTTNQLKKNSFSAPVSSNNPHYTSLFNRQAHIIKHLFFPKHFRNILHHYFIFHFALLHYFTSSSFFCITSTKFTINKTTTPTKRPLIIFFDALILFLPRLYQPCGAYFINERIKSVVFVFKNIHATLHTDNTTVPSFPFCRPFSRNSTIP